MPRNGSRERLDLVLVRRGLAETRERAHALILGGQVRVDGEPATRPAQVVIGDEGRAVAWARENLPGAATLRLDRKALCGALEGTETGPCVWAETGEALAWATVTPAEEVFYVR